MRQARKVATKDTINVFWNRRRPRATRGAGGVRGRNIGAMFSTRKRAVPRAVDAPSPPDPIPRCRCSFVAYLPGYDGGRAGNTRFAFCGRNAVVAPPGRLPPVHPAMRWYARACDTYLISMCITVRPVRRDWRRNFRVRRRPHWWGTGRQSFKNAGCASPLTKNEMIEITEYQLGVFSVRLWRPCD